MEILMVDWLVHNWVGLLDGLMGDGLAAVLAQKMDATLVTSKAAL